MADDIVTRLREWGGCGHDGSYDIEDGVPREMLRIAANEIERLQEIILGIARELDPQDLTMERVHSMTLNSPSCLQLSRLLMQGLHGA